MADWKRILTTNDDSAYKNSNVSGFLVDNGNDTTTGTITAAGFTTTGTWTFDDASSGTVGITSVHTGSGFADNDTSLMTAAAIKQYVAGEVSSGDITAVSLTGDSGGALNQASGDAGFTITGGTGVSTAGSGTTITINLNDQLEDVAAMSTTNTTHLAAVPSTAFEVLKGKGSQNIPSIGNLTDGTDGILVNDTTDLTTGVVKTTSFSAIKIPLQTLYWDFSHASGIKVSGGDVDIDNDLNVDGNCVIDGNLTVSGQTTTIDTTTLAVADNSIVLNSDLTGTTMPSVAGIEIERGDYPNVKLQFSESTNQFFAAIPNHSTDGSATSVVNGTLALLQQGTAAQGNTNRQTVGDMYIKTDDSELYIYM